LKFDLIQWHKCSVDKNILKEFSKRSNWQGIKHIFVYFLILLFSAYMAFITLGTWWTIFWFLVYGNIYTFSNPIWHECGHNLAFKSRRLNEIFYHITSFMYNYEPIRWRWSHHHHHTYTLHTNSHYDHEIQITKPTDLFFVLMMHLPGGNIFTFLFSHIETIKHALGLNSIVMKDCVPKEERPKLRFFARIHMIIWILIISFSIYFQTWLPILYLLLPFLYGTTLINIIHFIQHAGLENNAKDHRLTTRTVKLNTFLSFLSWNMEYHLEHHMFPMVPSYNLQRLHEAVKDQMPKPKNSLWDAYKEIIPAILKQAKDPNYIIKIKLPN
jgi:fatty acid desaturase